MRDSSGQPPQTLDTYNSFNAYKNSGFKEREVILEPGSSEENGGDSNDDDPRTATQLCNNDSIAQCSEDTYEE